jgi:hypothetical protein
VERRKSVLMSPVLPPILTRPDMSVADELRKLADLKNEGVLTQKEFDGEKKKLLSKGTTVESNSVQSQRVTPQIWRPRFIKLTSLRSHPTYKEANGIYVHTPKSFNKDIYVHRDGKQALYWYETKNGKGRWRQYTGSLGEFSFANPRSPTIGVGWYYPGDGLIKDKYNSSKFSNSDWKLEMLDTSNTTDKKSATRKTKGRDKTKEIGCVSCHGSGFWGFKKCVSCNGSGKMTVPTFLEWDASAKAPVCLSCGACSRDLFNEESCPDCGHEG